MIAHAPGPLAERDIVESAEHAFAAYGGLGKEIVVDLIAEIRRLRAINGELYVALDATIGWQETDPTSLGALVASNHARTILAKGKCPSCHREFKNGDACRMGGCPMGGDF